jgi:diguanylate cyclase (GGDEF) domain
VVQDVSYRKLHDSLTGLPNALQLDDTIAERMRDSRRSGRGFALAVMDVHYFAQLNVSVGRANADGALVTLADRLRDNAGDQDVVARVGGDEFAVLLDAVRDELDARHLLMHVLEVVHQLFRLANLEETFSLSIGVTLFPHDTDEPDTLRQHAVHALQLAKNQGRVVIVAFHDTVKDDEAAVAVRRLLIRDAMQHVEFTVFVQPSVRFGDASLCSRESLVRWPHPK